jgi:hypothetical protein
VPSSLLKLTWFNFFSLEEVTSHKAICSSLYFYLAWNTSVKEVGTTSLVTVGVSSNVIPFSRYALCPIMKLAFLAGSSALLISS